MYAHVLRKWSVAKILMYLWLPVLMLLVYWCQGASAMHLTPLRLSAEHQKSRYSAGGLLIPSEYQQFNRNNVPKQIDDSQMNKFSDYIENKINNLKINNNYNNNNINNKRDRRRGTTRDGLIVVRSSKAHERFERVSDDKNNRLSVNKKTRHRREKSPSTPSSASSSSISSSLPFFTTNDQRNFNVDQQTNDDNYYSRSEEIKLNPSESPQSLWAIRLREKRARIAAHRKQLALMSQSVHNINNNNNNNFNNNNNNMNNQYYLNFKNNTPINDRYSQNVDAGETITALVDHNNMFGRNRRESRRDGRHHQNQRRRFCSARDPTTLAFEAPTVFEGKVRSMSSDRRTNFSVTFEVKEVYKRQSGYKLPILIRLQFSLSNTSECDIYRETLKPRGYVREEFEQGKVYILFVEQIDLGNFTILGQPIKKTRRAVNDVKLGVSEKYDHNWHNSTSINPVTGQRAYIESLMANNSTIKEDKRLRIVCKIRGQPPPKVTWFKDGRSIGRNRTRFQFVHLRKRSELIIKSAILSDSGQYECRAKNKLARQPVTKFIRIEVLPKDYEITRYFPALPNNWPHQGTTCPMIGNDFCLNGGTCLFFKAVGEPACKCPDDFQGNRCELKNPTNLQPSTYDKKEQQQCGNNKYYGSYYC